MERVAMVDFVDFMMLTGIDRVALVRKIRDRAGRGGKDGRKRRPREFYDPVISVIREAAANGEPVGDVVTNDARLARVVPGLLAGYRCFAGTEDARVWTPPSETTLVLADDLEVQVAPSLAYELPQARLLVEPYTSTKEISRRRVMMTVALMLAAFPNDSCAVLDLMRGKLRRVPTPSPRFRLLARAEAAAFLYIYGRL